VPTDVMPAGRESGSAGANERQATDVPLLHYLTQLAQLWGSFTNFAGSGASQINWLAVVGSRIGRVVATKGIPFCRRVRF
jgi:hypothetical protein